MQFVLKVTHFRFNTKDFLLHLKNLNMSRHHLMSKIKQKKVYQSQTTDLKMVIALESFCTHILITFKKRTVSMDIFGFVVAMQPYGSVIKWLFALNG